MNPTPPLEKKPGRSSLFCSISQKILRSVFAPLLSMQREKEIQDTDVIVKDRTNKETRTEPKYFSVAEFGAHTDGGRNSLNSNQSPHVRGVETSDTDPCSDLSICRAAAPKAETLEPSANAQYLVAQKIVPWSTLQDFAAESQTFCPDLPNCSLDTRNLEAASCDNVDSQTTLHQGDGINWCPPICTCSSEGDVMLPPEVYSTFFCLRDQDRSSYTCERPFERLLSPSECAAGGEQADLVRHSGIEVGNARYLHFFPSIAPRINLKRF
ncbi:hypothetical protein B0H11DRAFT_1909902 [Mycena galericulata]|nr:hypothetical protein B0H11DRAFT_1909902 [Mycena galericulata]